MYGGVTASMAYFALYYEVVPDFAERRLAFREKHLRQVSEYYSRGELVLAGALDNGAAALLIFHTPAKQAAENFAKSDPYVVNGLVTAWHIRTWNVVTGNETSPSPVPPMRPSEIVRVWSAQTTPDKFAGYRAHFEKNVLPELRAVSGYLGAALFMRNIGDTVDIRVETYWRSLDAIHAFTGVNLETAVVADEAAGMLTNFDRQVRHYQVVTCDRG
jgi:uncharacterized protein